MQSIGIAISRTMLTAVLWEQGLFSTRLVHACSVPCGDPFSPEDASRLLDEVRKTAGGGTLPHAVVSLPPSWTFLRQIELPVTDLPRAKKIHAAELEGNLPVEDEEILSDILPSPPGRPGHFLAIAARRSAVEKAVAVFSGAGFRVDRVVTDHVSALQALLASGSAPDGMCLSFQSDILALFLAGGTIVRARQLPGPLADSLAGWSGAWDEIAPAGTLPGTVTCFGRVPDGLSGAFPGAPSFSPPAGIEDGFLLAYGAALTPFNARETGGFSLRTSAETEAERGRETFRERFAAAAVAAALLAAIASIEIAKSSEEKKVDRVRAQIRKEFAEAVPDVKVAVQASAQIREKVQALSRQQKELGADFSGPSRMLGKVSQALPAGESISVRDLSFESGKLRIAGEAGNVKTVEQYRSALSNVFGPGSNVTIQESQGGAKDGGVRFTILVEERGMGRGAS